MVRAKTLATVLALTLGLALFGCSDDDTDPPVKNDTGTADLGAKKDGAADQAVPDMAQPDAAQPDVGPTPDLSPDAPPTSKYWSVESITPANELTAIGGIDGSNIWAVGKKGLILKYNGSTWATETNPDSGKSDLHSLLIQPASNTYYAFGANMYLKYTGSTWAKGYSYTTSYYYNFRDAWGKPNDYIYGCGEMNSSSYYYMSYKTSTSSGYFSSISFGSSGAVNDYMYGIWGLETGNAVFAVGNKGTIVRCTNSTCSSSSYWTKMTSGTDYHLKDVFGFSASDVYAVGYNGTILHYDGTSWKKMTTGTYTYFNGIWGSSPSNIFAVGHPLFKSDESVFHYDGKSWKKIPPPGVAYLNAVWGYSPTDVYAVGRSKILKFKGVTP